LKAKFKCEKCEELANGTIRRVSFVILEQNYKCHKCGFRRHVLLLRDLMPDDSEYEELRRD